MTVTIVRDGGVAIVTLDRPEKKNAMTLAMRERLWTAFEDLSEDDAVRAVVLTGAGRDFCSGMDVAEMGGGAAQSMMRVRRLHRVGRAIAGLMKPVIAVVDGACVGAGWSYALACDIVIATPQARFAQIFKRIGYAPDAGAVWLLRQQLGEMRAKELIYSARTVAAEEAFALGLVLEIVDDGAIMARALELARSFASGPTLALGMAKRQFAAAPSLSFTEFLELEFSMQPLMAQTQDHREGLAAFREKRAAKFEGR